MYRPRFSLAPKIVDRLAYFATLTHLHVLDWVAGPIAETLADRNIKEGAERLRRAFPKVDFGNPKRHVRRGLE